MGSWWMTSNVVLPVVLNMTCNGKLMDDQFVILLVVLTMIRDGKLMDDQ